MKTLGRSPADIRSEFTRLVEQAADALLCVQPDREAILRRRIDTLLDEYNATKEPR